MVPALPPPFPFASSARPLRPSPSRRRSSPPGRGPSSPPSAALLLRPSGRARDCRRRTVTVKCRGGVGRRGPAVDGCVGDGGPCGGRPPPLPPHPPPRRPSARAALHPRRQRRFSRAAPPSPLPAACPPSGCRVGSAAVSPGASAVGSPPGAAGSAALGGRRCIDRRLPRHGSSSSPRLHRLSFYSGRWLTTIHHCTSLPPGIRGPRERATLRTQLAQLVSSGRLAVLPNYITEDATPSVN